MQRGKLPTHIAKAMSNLETQVLSLLHKSVKLGKTFIITNAGEGWVENSSYQFMPNVYKEYFEPEVPIIQVISARSLFEKDYPSKFLPLTFRLF